MNIGRAFHLAPLALVLSLIGGCGGSGGGDGGGLAGGGIGGTGSGTITGFGSIIVNDTREFELIGDTQVRIDGEAATDDDLALGMVVRFEVGDDVNADFTAGTASVIDVEHQIKGPVTSASPLTVLGQNVTVTGSTVLDGFSDMSTLSAGAVLEVSGHADANGVVRATRLELKPAGVPVWKLTGVISAVSGAGFAVGTQSVLLNGVSPRDCASGLSAGALVEIKATPIEGFNAGDALDSVTEVECVAAGLSVSGSPSSAVIAGEIEGFVTSVSTTDSRFIVDGQTVNFSAGTVFEGGSIEDLVAGVKLEAEGRFDTQSGILSAVKIRFREARVRIEAPVASADIVAGESLDIIGIHVIANGQTEDDDGVIGAANGDQQVEVRGYVDGDGNVIAEEVRERGNSNLADVRLRGPVGAINASQQTLAVLGVNVDLSTAGNLDDSQNDNINVDAFFQQLRVGLPVQVQGEYDTATSTLFAEEAEIED